MDTGYLRDGLRKSIGNDVRLSPRQGSSPRRTTSKAILDLYARALRTRVNAIEAELEIGFSFVGVARCAATVKSKRKALGKARTSHDSAVASFHLIRNDLPEPAMNSIVDRFVNSSKRCRTVAKPSLEFATQS
jgi:hypothetical protein